MAEEKTVAPKTNPIAQTPPVTPPAPQPVSDNVELPKTEKESKVEQVSQLSDVPNEVKPVDVDSLIPSDPYYMDPLFYEVANYFGIEQGEYDGAKNYLSDIVDYVIRDIKSNQPDKVLLALRALERGLVPPGYDEKRYKNVHKYIRLAQKQGAITQAMKAFELENKAHGGPKWK